MNSKGYILFICYHKCDGFTNRIDIGDTYCRTKKDLMNLYDSEWDDKWDVRNRNKIDYFYLDLATMKYTALPKWKNPYSIKGGINTDRETILSRKIFRNIGDTK